MLCALIKSLLRAIAQKKTEFQISQSCRSFSRDTMAVKGLNVTMIWEERMDDFNWAMCSMVDQLVQWGVQWPASAAERTGGVGCISQQRQCVNKMHATWSTSLYYMVTINTPICIPLGQSSEAVWKSRWPFWAFRLNEPYGFCGRKATLKRASALVTVCP